MRAYVNGCPLDLLPGMRVKHALIRAGLLPEVTAGKKVYDRWGNELGLDGALEDGMEIWVRGVEKET
jgi:hypothetical protein